jgi:hypothetical protein
MLATKGTRPEGQRMPGVLRNTNMMKIRRIVHRMPTMYRIAR